MSNFLAVATVTAALQQIVYEAVSTDVPGAEVTTLRPGGVSSGLPATGVNAYLYQVSPNAAYRNADLPTRDSEGRLTQRPQVALDLHYMLTFYGNDAQLEPQRLLGSAARALHSRPVLSRQLIRDTIMDPMFSYLASSDLAESVEMVKFTPVHMSLEDMSKLWSVFFQTQYALSVAYQGTVVLIESEDTPRPALPVRGFNVYTKTFRQPIVRQVTSKAGENQPIVSGSDVVIKGQNLRGDITMVRIREIEIAPVKVSDKLIELALPSGLKAGVHGLQVVHPAMIGTPPTPHTGVESNVSAFVLQPKVKMVSAPSSSEVTVALQPKIGKDQKVILLLNEINPPSDRHAYAYSFRNPVRNAPDTAGETHSLTFPISGVTPSDYLARVQVDGAESSLESNADPSNPQYIEPKVSIP